MKKSIIIGIILLSVIASFIFPSAMLSPGKLLDGHHKLDQQCKSCHNIFSGVSNDKCISCHELDKIGMDGDSLQYAADYVPFHQHLDSLRCIACHTDHLGRHPDLSLINKFEHDMVSSTIINLCIRCHKTPSDSLHLKLTDDCRLCHATNNWEVSNFNHDLITMDQTNCASCHAKPDDAYHQNLTLGCDKCHTTNKWSPSTFDHSDYFVLDKDHNVKCNTCHLNNNYLVYTCYGCHEHREQDMIDEHRKEGIINITDCASCHKSSDEHDIRINRSKDGLNKTEVKGVREYMRSKDHDDNDDH